MSYDLDLAWKEALTSFLPQFLELVLPEVHQDIDWSFVPEFLDSELRSLHRGMKGQRRHADLVVRIHLRAGGPALVVLHFEVQSQKDGDLPLRMRVYHSRLFERHRCPVYSLAIPESVTNRGIRKPSRVRLRRQAHLCGAHVVSNYAPLLDARLPCIQTRLNALGSHARRRIQVILGDSSPVWRPSRYQS